ncbi:MAG: hypothetical protein ACXW5U_14060 [Thermoanaerobaculia bacterium]
MTRFITLVTLLLAAAVQSAFALEVPMTFDVTATVVSEYAIDLTASTRVIFRTENLSPGSAPVLHLFDAGGSEVSMNDNGGPGLAARLAYTPPVAGNYRLLVRSRTMEAAGTCDVTMNDASWQSAVAFGGWQTTLEQLRAGEMLETVKMPNGAKGAHLLLVLKADGVGAAIRAYGNGTTGAAAVSLPAALGNRIVVAGVNRRGSAGAVRLVRNDKGINGHDVDADGLGDELEAAIGTCSALSGIAGNFDCSQATDARDTDGDGISDGWEVLGRRGVSPHQPLPLWGADPRHKDLFVEVDFMQRSPGEAERLMTPAHALKFAAYYGDRIGPADPLRQAYRAAILRNPDHESGIRVHLDIGVDPISPADATTFGDWGGHNVIPPVQNSSGAWVGARYQDAWQEHLLPARHGIFRHAPVPAGGGGSNTENWLSFSAGIDQPWVLAHESGHAQGMGHSGPSKVTGVVDVNCKPNYPSMMNYAYQTLENEIGFGDGLTARPLNNAALRESRAVPPGDSSYLDILEESFEYYVDRDSGDVDWNRDGEFAAEGTSVRAYANYAPTSIGGCEFTKYNVMQVPSGVTSVSPAIARYRGRTYVFWATAANIAYVWTSSSLDCPVPDITSCGGWNGAGTIPIAGAQGLDAVPIRFGTAERLMLVAVTASGRLAQTRLRIQPWGDSWTPVSEIDANEVVSGEPSLGAMSDCSITLAYKGESGVVTTRRMNCASWRWTAAQPALDANGARLLISQRASPSIARGYLPSQGTTPKLLGAFIGSDARLRLYAKDTATGRWQIMPDLEQTERAKGRPAIAWLPSHDDDDPGRLYLLYSQATADEAYRWVRSYVKVTRDASGAVSKEGRVGLDGWFSNKWLLGPGLDALYEEGVDTNLRTAITTSAWVRLFPKSDGIQDFTYRNYNDWQVHRVGLCRQVVNPGGMGSDPIHCPEQDW